MNNSPLVFLIDDDIDDQDIFSIAANKTGQSARCVFANDGIQALEKISGDKSFIPDFIFIDMNMPKMNGKQCLGEIKKIERLKHVPVYMYSTSADESTVKENIELGATDFIIKPSDVHSLTNILNGIFQRQFLIMFTSLILFLSSPGTLHAQTSDTLPPVKELKKLSVEQLMDIVVTSVSKSPEKLSEVASAIQVITSEDIHRSTATRLPEALRLATNIQVAQSGSHDWGVTARGFNGLPVTSSTLANKLLVMIDGRSVYTPLFGGVFWDVQNVLMQDLDRIEVISGPGGSLWGANAVNGIVNIISKEARETQGVYASVSAGNFMNDFETVRYGSHVDSTLFFRVYGQHFKFNSTSYENGIDAMDSWHMNQEGFRADYIQSNQNKFTFQGDFYQGKDDDTGSTYNNGQNLLGRFTHTFSQRSGLTMQFYFDRTYRNITSQSTVDIMNTYDFDFQHDIRTGRNNKIVWGLGYRHVNDHITTMNNDFFPVDKNLPLFNGFVQDQLAIIPERLELTIGTKLLYNVYTDWEFHPTIRMAWMPNENQTIWAAASRAVRTPTRFDADNKGQILGSFGNFQSENVNAYELGYRFQHQDKYYISVSTFYNVYTDLRSVDTNVTTPPLFYFANHLSANTYGFEISGKVILTNWWSIRGGYTFLKEDFKNTSPKTYPQTYLFEAIDPQNQILLQSMMNVGKGFMVDAIFRYVDKLPQSIDGSIVPAYSTMNLRVAWEHHWLTLSVMGKNLFQDDHLEFGYRRIPRGFIGKISVVF
jgi:iron complex outermembrane receptor protein